jgi:hypothetical protein
MTEFDVFLAHNSTDKEQIKLINEKLKQRGIKTWLDVEQVQPGKSFQDAIQKAIPSIKSAAIFIGKQGLGMWQGLELKVILSMCLKQYIPVIPVLLPGVEDLPQDMIFLKEFNYINIYDGQIQIANEIVNKRVLDLLEWGIKGRKPEDDSAEHIRIKPGKVPNQARLVELVVEDIQKRKDNPYTDATIWFEAIEKIIDDVVDAISKSNDQTKDKTEDPILLLLGKFPIFTAYRNSQELLINQYIMNRIKDKLKDKLKKNLQNKEGNKDKTDKEIDQEINNQICNQLYQLLPKEIEHND